MSDSPLYPPSEHVQAGSTSEITNLAEYRSVWAEATSNPDQFWLRQTKNLIAWRKEPTIGQEGDFHSVTEKPFSWFSDGELNITESCLDRHLDTLGDKTAILWEGDEPTDIKKLSYREVY